MAIHFEVVICKRILFSKAKKDGLTSVMFNVLKAKIFQYDFLEEHNVWEITVIGHQHL